MSVITAAPEKTCGARGRLGDRANSAADVASPFGSEQRAWRTRGTVSDREAMAPQRRTHSLMPSSTLLQPRSAQMMAMAKI
jgi:hypothetical protein